MQRLEVLIFGEIWDVRASPEKVGNWRWAVCSEFMMPPSGTITEMLGMAGYLFVHGRLGST
jgi:hypothetical protein